ncbi:MAG: hypothetical protein WCE62_00415 [Polyangiales bacterium]
MCRLVSSFLLVTAIGLVACGSSGESECTVDATYDPSVEPSNFTSSTTIDNPLLPLVPGATYTYQGGSETIMVSVTNTTKVILGITCVEVRDTVRVDGEVTEDTLDWYAQDDEGNVWYMGEDTKEYEGGEVVSTEGSWEAGVDGAKPGIVMHATQPAIGEPYRQEFYACEAEDFAEVVSLDEDVTVPVGAYTNCLQTREFTPLEPDVNEYKYYCPDLGLVLEVDVVTDARTELIQVSS